MTTPRFGVGLRSEHVRDVAAAPRTADWYELLTDNWIGAVGARRTFLERLRADVPLALHGVSLSIAGGGPIETPYLRGLRALAEAIEPAFVSDHLCWTGLGGHESHDLLPVAYTDEVLDHVAARVDAVQAFLGRRLLLENASAYVAFRADALAEAEFFAALCRRTGCGLLLDVNNLFVNAANLGLDPAAYLAAIPRESVGYLHLAGHAVLADVRIDTHDADVPDEVWSLYETVARLVPGAPVIVERDDRIPPFAALVAEAEAARARHARALAAAAPAAAPAAPAPRPAPAPDTALWHALQKRFFERVTGAPPEAELRAETLLDDARPVRAARGMRVYHDAYRTGLRRALATNFGALARVLRADDFDALADAYSRAHPPRSHDFVPLGAALAAFVRRFDFAATYGVARDALAELAALEQAQLEVQAAPADDAVAPAALAAIAPEAWDGARFAFGRAFRIVRATHDVLPAVEAAARGEDPPLPAPGPVAYLVHRAGEGVRTERIALDDATVLEALAARMPFAEACRAGATEADDDRALAEHGARVLVAACERRLVASISAASTRSRTPPTGPRSAARTS
jgi:uncharacterized protein (UPF0276 family)